MKHLLIICLLIVFLCACDLKEPLPFPSEETYDCRRVKVAAGPEDFVLDTWHKAPRLLISSFDRRHTGKNGGIFYFNIDTEETGELHRLGEPAQIVAFKPQGVDIRHNEKDTLLYVILDDPHGHQKREENAVAIYSVEDDALRFVKLLEDARYLWSPNDLSVLPSGEIYLTNDYRENFDIYFRKKTSEVVYYNPVAEKWSKAADHIAFASGILAENERVFVAAALDNQVLEFTRNKDGALGKAKVIAYLKGPDKLTKQGDYLFVAAHFDDLAFTKHRKDPSAHCPSVVFRIDPDQLSRSTVFVDNGDLISAASTAMAYGNRLYVSEVFDPYLVICKIPEFIYR